MPGSPGPSPGPETRNGGKYRFARQKQARIFGVSFSDFGRPAPPLRRFALSLVETSRLPTSHARNPQTPSGRRRLVATAHPLATQNFLGRDVPAPTRSINYFGGGDVSSPWPPSHPKLSGTRRPSPYPQHQLLRGWRRPVSTPPTPPQRPSSIRHFPCPSPTRHQNPERVSDSSRG